jgi:hypothetical protein
MELFFENQTHFREIVKIIVAFNFPKVISTFGKFLQVKHGTFKFTISLN